MRVGGRIERKEVPQKQAISSFGRGGMMRLDTLMELKVIDSSISSLSSY